MAKKANKKVTEVKEASKGIIILAMGNAYYGNYALQLAMSLKSTSYLPVSIAYADRGIAHLSDFDKSLFDKIIQIPEKCYKTGTRSTYLKAKAHLYDLSPYDETIYLDADVLWLPKKPINELFEQLKGVDFTMQNRGAVDINANNGKYIIWADTEEIKKGYNFKEGKLYNLASEFIYFKKTKEVKALFEQTKKNYEALKIPFMNFAGWIPDELPFAISMIQLKMYPHQERFTPIYWEQFERKRLKPNELYDQYYAYSLGGASYDKQVKTFYDNLAQFYCNRFGKKVFPLKDKRSYLPERSQI